MKTKILLAAALLLGVGHANAFRVFNSLETAVELSLSALTLPTSSSGSVSFRACEDCPIATHRLIGQTSYVLNGKPVAFVDLLAFDEAMRNNRTAREATLATVFLDVNSQRVTRIVIRGSTP